MVRNYTIASEKISVPKLKFFFHFRRLSGNLVGQRRKLFLKPFIEKKLGQYYPIKNIFMQKFWTLFGKIDKRNDHSKKQYNILEY